MSLSRCAAGGTRTWSNKDLMSCGAACTNSGTTSYDLRIEPLESLGFGVAAGLLTFGEWFFDPALNPGTLNRVWTMGIDGAGGLTLRSRRPYTTSLGTLFFAPGTVINVDLQVSPEVDVVVENVTRPVVQITPRSGRPASFSTAVLTATVTHDYALSVGSACWSGRVNEVKS